MMVLMPADVNDLMAMLDLTRVSEWEFRGPQPDTLFQRLFGGHVLAQTLMAAMHTIPEDRPVHSLHAYFLRPGSPEHPLTFQVEAMRDGRSFSARRVNAFQQGKPIFALSSSFHRPEPGLEHSAMMPEEITPPEQSPPMREVLERSFGRRIRTLSEWDALDVRLAAGARPSSEGGTMAAWVKTHDKLPDDPHIHAAVLAYLSDITLLSVATVQHEMEFLSPGMQAASIDHAMWFHRPVRVDEWLLYDMISPSTSGARGFCTGRLFQGTEAIASCAQEGLIRIVEPAE